MPGATSNLFISDLGLEGPETVREASGAKKSGESFGGVACPVPLYPRHSLRLRRGIGGKFPQPKLIGFGTVQIRPERELVFRIRQRRRALGLENIECGGKAGAGLSAAALEEAPQ